MENTNLLNNNTNDMNDIDVSKEINNPIVKEMDEVRSMQRIDLYKLVDNYNKRASTKLKEEFLKNQIKVVSYREYGTKMFLADTIVKQCCLKNGDIYIDSCKRYILYIYTLLKYWTNLDIKEKDVLVQYDLLDRNNLVEKIIALIPDKEVATFKTILDMKQDDLIKNNYGLQAFLDKKLKSLYPILSGIFEPLTEAVKDNLEMIDKEEFAKNLINKIMDSNS